MATVYYSAYGGEVYAVTHEPNDEHYAELKSRHGKVLVTTAADKYAEHPDVSRLIVRDGRLSER